LGRSVATGSEARPRKGRRSGVANGHGALGSGGASLRPGDPSLLDWEQIEAVDEEPTGPDGHLWPERTPLLRKLGAWASWAIWLRERNFLDDDN
jgi:hypothetical protein